MAFCHGCGTSWPDDATFCGQCGSPLGTGTMAGPRTVDPPAPPFQANVSDAASTRTSGPGTGVAGSSRASPLPPIVAGLLLGFAAAFAAWVLISPIELADKIDPFKNSWSGTIVFWLICAVPIGVAAAVIPASGGQGFATFGPRVALTGGASVVGGVAAGAIAHANFYGMFNPSSIEGYRMVWRFQTALVLLAIGIAVGLGLALSRSAPRLAFVATAGAGLVSGLLYAQVAITWGLYGGYPGYHWRLSSALVVCLPICFAVGLVVQLTGAQVKSGSADASAYPPSPPGAVPAMVSTGGDMAGVGSPPASLGVRGGGSAPPPNWSGPRRNNGLAIASMVLGILGWALCGVGTILAIIFGHVALSQIKHSNGTQTGRGMAIAGLVLGYALLTIIVIAWIALASSSSNS